MAATLQLVYSIHSDVTDLCYGQLSPVKTNLDLLSLGPFTHAIFVAAI